MSEHVRYCNVIAIISALEHDARRRGGRYRTFKNGCEAFEFAFNSKLASPKEIGELIMEFGGSVFALGIERERLRKIIDGSDARDPRFHFHLTPRHKRPHIPSIADAKPCPDHPGVEPGIGFGMAGGGYGTYAHCEVCGRILGKDEEPDE